MGEPLFNGSTQAKQLGRFFEVLGAIPDYMTDAAPRKVQDKYFELVPATQTGPTGGSTGMVRKLKEECIRTGDKQFRTRKLEDIVGATTGGPDGRFMREPHHSHSDYVQFLSLIRSMLQYDSAARIRPAEALRHPFITLSYRRKKSDAGAGVAPTEGAPNAEPTSPMDVLDAFAREQRDGHKTPTPSVQQT